MLTLGTIFGGAYFSMGGSSAAAKKQQGPPINAQSPDEEKFIKYVIALELAFTDLRITERTFANDG